MTIRSHLSITRPAFHGRGMFSRLVVVGALAGLAVSAAQQADAQPRFGGLRGGGAAAMKNGGGFGGLRREGAVAAQRPARGSRQQLGTGAGERTGQAAQRFGSWGQGGRSANANTGAAASGNGNRRASYGGNTSTRANYGGNGNSRTGYANSGVVGSGNGNTAVVNNGNVNNGNIGSGNVNTGNVAVGNDVNVAVDADGWGGAYGYPVGAGAAYATGVAVGTTATAAAVGSSYYALPSGCSPYSWGGYRYYTCGSTWYRATSQGGSTVYVVVADPR